MELQQALQWRYAVRRFAPVTIANHIVDDLLEAARLSASSYGLQPYRLIAVQSRSVRRELMPYSFGQDKVAECSHLIVLAAQTCAGEAIVEQYLQRMEQSRGVSRESLRKLEDHLLSAMAAKSNAERLAWAREQAYIALGTLLTAAALRGVDSCPMTGIDPAGYDAVLGLREQQLTTTAICALGQRHPEDNAALAPKLRVRFSEMVLRK